MISSKDKLPNLDALRFLAFLGVFMFHSFYTENLEIKNSGAYSLIKYQIFGNGNLGVNFFFVLSGFLITYLLIVRIKEQKGVKLLSFYKNRVLRIWPLFFIALVIGFIGYPVLKEYTGNASMETATWWKYVLFINNFEFIEKGPPDAAILGVLWSIAVEEQFYLFWPLIFIFFREKVQPIIFVLVILGSLMYRTQFEGYANHEYHTLSCIGDMAVGAFAAYLVTYSNQFKNRLMTMKTSTSVIVYIVFIVLIFTKKQLYEFDLGAIFYRLLFAVAAVALILEQVYSDSSPIKLGQSRVLTYLGKRSYGLYIYHFVGIVLTLNLTAILGLNDTLVGVVIIDTSIALIITIIIAILSFRFIEKPLLSFKDK